MRTPEFIELMDFEAGRARAYYKESQPLLDLVDRGSRASLGALISIYSRLLDRIEAQQLRRLLAPHLAARGGKTLDRNKALLG